jgi:hypothetical protein
LTSHFPLAIRGYDGSWGGLLALPRLSRARVCGSPGSGEYDHAHRVESVRIEIAIGLLGLVMASSGRRPACAGTRVTAVAFSDGKQVMTGGARPRSSRQEADTGRLKNLSGHRTRSLMSCFRRTASTSRRRTPGRSWNLWNLESGKKTDPLPGSHWGSSFAGRRAVRLGADRETR